MSYLFSKGYCSTHLYKAKVAKHTKLFETAVDGRYCKHHFLEQRIRKVTIMHAPLDTKSTRKIVYQITEITKGQCN